MADPHPEVFAVGDEMHAAALRIGDSKKAVREWEEWPNSNRYGAEFSRRLNTLRQLRELRLDVDARLREIELEAARDALKMGARWQDIAEATGITRQSAQATYRDRENKPRASRRPSSAPKVEPIPAPTFDAEPVQDFEAEYVEREYNPDDFDPKIYEPD